MKKLLVLLVLLGAAGAAGYYYWKNASAPKPSFITAEVTKADIVQSVTATGDLQPVLTVEVSSQISGIITEVLVDYNSPVKQNAVLARIDPATYESKLAQANAQLANTRANHQLVTLNATRIRRLFDEKLVSQQDLDQADAQLAQADAQLQIQQAAVDTAKTDLERCTLYSPVDGIVLDKLAEVGKTVAASFNAPTLFTLAEDLKKMQIQAAVSEADIGAVEVGQFVNFTVDAYPDRQFRGKVSQIRNNPVTVQSVVTYSTIIEVKNDDLKLKPGMTASVSIITARKPGATRIPNAALRVRIPDALLPQTDAAPGNATAAAGDAVDMAAVRKLQVELGINSLRRLAPTDRERLVKTAEERGVRLPARVLNPAAEQAAVTTRTVYKLAGTAEKPLVEAVTVKLGITDGSGTEVLEGLAPGDAVITSAYLTGATTAAAPASNPLSGGPQRRR
ncbi:MAG: efflux RND transporter periplasmic adaptor subunit [Opitutaceae bacterium]|jgi:HlyD family secretion protein|nr:efflux RND transporter periplasmic adaptor subunit [Opitutaceae bacterium]